MFFILSSFWQKVKDFDQWLFIKINSGLVNPFFDAFLPFMRNSDHWIPLYLFLIAFMLINFKEKGAKWILFCVLTFAMTDMVGTFILKNNIDRWRPCADPDFYSHVRLVISRCSGASSFPSNHAINHFGMAAFFFATTKHFLRNWGIAGLVWAAIIVFAQVYVGVHYPFDVIAGTVLGLFFGTVMGRLYNKQFGFVNFDNQPTRSS